MFPFPAVYRIKPKSASGGSGVLCLLLFAVLAGCDGGDKTAAKSSAHSGNSDYAFDAYGNPGSEGIDEADGDTAVESGLPVRSPSNSTQRWDPPPLKVNPLSGAARTRQLRYINMINNHARAAGMDPAFIQAIVTIESVYQPCIKSPAGAVGLMQIMPDTANGLRRVTGITAATRCNPDLNVKSGIAYFKQMTWAKGNLQAMASGYNTGPARAKALFLRNTNSKYWRAPQPSTSNGVPGPRWWGGETYNYARKMAGYYELYKANPHLIGIADNTPAPSECDARGIC